MIEIRLPTDLLRHSLRLGRIALLLIALAFSGLVTAVKAKASALDPRTTPPSPDEVDAYAHSINVSKAEANRRLIIQRRGYDLNDALKRALGEQYAGVWIDEQTGEFHVGAVDSTDRSTIALAAEHRGLSGDVVTDPKRHTWNELTASQDGINRGLTAILGNHGFGTGPDPIGNRVVVKVDSALLAGSRARIQALADSSAVPVDIEPVEGAADPVDSASACSYTFPDCGFPLPGGARMFVPFTNAPAKYCSTGWIAFNANLSRKYMITAGHCVQNPSTYTWKAIRTGQSVTLGNDAGSNIGASGDLGIIDVTSSPWNTSDAGGGGWGAYYVDWRGSVTVNAAWAKASSTKNMAVCGSGGASLLISDATRCGTVQGTGITRSGFQSGTAGNLTSVNFCPTEGDSGGAVWANNTAYGMLKGREMDCSLGYYSEVTAAENYFGVHVATAG